MTDTLEEPRLGWFDMVLTGIFLVGIYMGVAIHVTAKIPFPAAPSGVVGMILLWRRRDLITARQLAAFLGVVLLYVGSILSAFDIAFLGKRFTGLIQLTYSLVLGYTLYLTLTQGSRRQVAWLFLGFCLFIVIGCLLEDYGGLRPISDRVRLAIYNYGIYDADLRDQLLYGRIRPKLFTSEPSAVTFAFTLYSFAWLVISPWRWKLLGYLALLGVGLFAMPGPTLLLMLVLVVAYELFLSGRKWGPGAGIDTSRMIKIAVLSACLLGVAVVGGSSIYSKRLQEINNGGDASFFYRETGPALVARDVVKHHPIAGAGLTGEVAIRDEVINVFMRSHDFYWAWPVPRIGDVLTNYFWLHWIYLGLFWGVVTLVGVSAWLRIVGAPSVLFCWAVWVVMGQASGAYVGPKTWVVLFLAAAAAALYRRQAVIGAAHRAETAQFGFAAPAALRAWPHP